MFSDKKVLFLVHHNSSYAITRYTDIAKSAFEYVNIINYAELFNSLGHKNMEKAILDDINRHSYDLILLFQYADTFYLDIEFLYKISITTVLTPMLFDDESFFESHSKFYAQVCSSVCTTDPLAVAMYNRYEIPAFLAHPVDMSDREVYKNLNLNRDIDVSFIGNVFVGDRLEYIDYLKKNGINIEVFGKGSENGFLTHEGMIEIMNRSKINLNFTRMNNRNWFNEEDLFSDKVRAIKGRPVEIAFTNSFCLTEFSPQVEFFYKDDEIVQFYSKEDMLEKINFYLKNFDKAKEIANNMTKKTEELLLNKNYNILGFMQLAFENADRERLTRSNFKILKTKLFLHKEIGMQIYYAILFIQDKKYSFAIELLKERVFKERILDILLGIRFTIKHFLYKRKWRLIAKKFKFDKVKSVS